MTKPKRKKVFSDYDFPKPEELTYGGFDHLVENEKTTFVPMKNRMFQQNYKPKSFRKDEYNKAYQLQVSEEDRASIDRLLAYKDIKLEIEPQVLTFLEEGWICRSDWDYFERDIRYVSKKLKNVQITIECDGQDPLDFWVYHAHNGKFAEKKLEIVFPEFSFERLQ